MSWYDATAPVTEVTTPGKTPGTQVMETVTLSPERLDALADLLGVQVTQDKEGKYVAVPANADLNDPKFQANFIQHWMDQGSVNGQAEAQRNTRTATYKAMDTNMAEASIALDAYADEALGMGFVESPIKVTINDKNVGKLVTDLMVKNQIFTRARSMIRNLIKYGDLGYKITLPKSKDSDFMDITLEYVDPGSWECVTAQGSQTVVGYNLGEHRQGRNRSMPTSSKAGRTQLWEFVQMSVFDEDSRPYGRSLLEPMRVDFDHLVTMEALLALSRASRVERLVIKVPTGSQNAVQAAQKIQAIKAQYKSMIFKDSSLGGAKSYARTPALTDVLFVPSDSGFSIDRLPSGMDVSSTDDVEYFRNRAFVVTGLPKGYFLHDATVTRGAALQQQDIMFARKLVQYQTAFVEGLTKMITILAVYVDGADLENLEVKVELQRPPQLDLTMVQYYLTLAQTAAQLIQTWQQSSGGQIQTPPDMYSLLLMQLGMPPQVAEMFSLDGPLGAEMVPAAPPQQQLPPGAQGGDPNADPSMDPRQAPQPQVQSLKHKAGLIKTIFENDPLTKPISFTNKQIYKNQPLFETQVVIPLKQYIRERNAA